MDTTSYQNTCKLEDLFSCKAYKDERDILELIAEDIINREGLNSIGDINLKVLYGAIENLSKQGQNEMLSALLRYIKCTNRFRQN